MKKGLVRESNGSLHIWNGKKWEILKVPEFLRRKVVYEMSCFIEPVKKEKK